MPVATTAMSPCCLGRPSICARPVGFPAGLLLFQPAEEEGGGGQVMVQEGVMDRFDITEVYGIHNAPGVPFGHFQTNPGALMASVDTAIVH